MNKNLYSLLHPRLGNLSSSEEIFGIQAFKIKLLVRQIFSIFWIHWLIYWSILKICENSFVHQRVAYSVKISLKSPKRCESYSSSNLGKKRTTWIIFSNATFEQKISSCFPSSSDLQTTFLTHPPNFRSICQVGRLKSWIEISNFRIFSTSGIVQPPLPRSAVMVRSISDILPGSWYL